MTAEEFWDKNNNGDWGDNIEEMMIEFAKYHVQEALKIASESAEVEEYIIDGIFYVNKDSILNAYDLNQIK